MESGAILRMDMGVAYTSDTIVHKPPSRRRNSILGPYNTQVHSGPFRASWLYAICEPHAPSSLSHVQGFLYLQNRDPYCPYFRFLSEGKGPD